MITCVIKLIPTVGLLSETVLDTQNSRTPQSSSQSRSSAPPNNIPDAMADLGEPDGHDEAAPASSSSNSVR